MKGALVACQIAVSGCRIARYRRRPFTGGITADGADECCGNKQLSRKIQYR